MVFVEGIAGEAFGDLGLAVVVSLTASLLVAIYLIPMLASRRGMTLSGVAQRAPPAHLGGRAGRRRRLRSGRPLAAPPAAVAWRRRRLAAGAGVAARGAARRRLPPRAAHPRHRLRADRQARCWPSSCSSSGCGARPSARWWRGCPASSSTCRSRPPTACSRGSRPAIRGRSAGRSPTPARWCCWWSPSLGVTWAAARGLDSELLPEVHQGEFTFEVALPVGTPLEETDAILKPVERAILAEKESIKTLILTVGFDAANSRRSDEGEHTAQFKILLEPPHPSFGQQLAAFFRGRLWRDAGVAGREEAVVERLRRRLAEIPDLEARVSRPVLFSSRTPIEVEVHGDDLARLKAMGERVRQVMAGLPELADVEGTLKSGAPEVQIVYDRNLLARYGLNLRDHRRAGAQPGQGLRGQPLQPPRPPGADPRPPRRARPRDGRGRARAGGESGRRAADPPLVGGRRAASARGRARCAGWTAGGWRWSTPTSPPGSLGGAVDAIRTALRERDRLARRHDLRHRRPERGVAAQPGEPLPGAGAVDLPGLRDHGGAVRVAGPAAGDHVHHPAGLLRHRGHPAGRCRSACRSSSSSA